MRPNKKSAKKQEETSSEKKGYGSYREEIKGGNIGRESDEAATGDRGTSIGGGLGTGRVTDKEDKSSDEERSKH